MPPQRHVAHEDRLFVRIALQDLPLVCATGRRWSRETPRDDDAAPHRGIAAPSACPGRSAADRLNGTRCPGGLRFADVLSQHRAAQREQLGGALGRHAAEIFGLADQGKSTALAARRARRAPGSAAAGRRGRARTRARSRRVARAAENGIPRGEVRLTWGGKNRPGIGNESRALLGKNFRASPARTGPRAALAPGKQVPARPVGSTATVIGRRW